METFNFPGVIVAAKCLASLGAKTAAATVYMKYQRAESV